MSTSSFDFGRFLSFNYLQNAKPPEDSILLGEAAACGTHAPLAINVADMSYVYDPITHHPSSSGSTDKVGSTASGETNGQGGTGPRTNCSLDRGQDQSPPNRHTYPELFLRGGVLGPSLQCRIPGHGTEPLSIENIEVSSMIA